MDESRRDYFTWEPGDLQLVEKKYTFYEIENGKKIEIATMLDSDYVVTGEKADFVREKLTLAGYPKGISPLGCFKDYPNILIESKDTGKRTSF